MALKRVSYILPVKDRVDCVKWFFDNFRKASVDELVIVDGDSKDGTKELIKEYGDIVDVFVSEPDSSAGEATNKGILLASGEFIKTHSIDDIIFNLDDPIMCMEFYQYIDLLVLGGLKQRGDKTLRLMLPPDYGKQCEDVFIHGSCGAGFLIRKSSFDRLGLFNPELVANDREFALRTIRNGIVCSYPGIFYWHNSQSDNSITSTHILEWCNESSRLFRKYCRKIYYRERILRFLKIRKGHEDQFRVQMRGGLK